MNIQSNKNILSIFFYLSVLALLTACGSSSSGGGTAATPPPAEPPASACNSATHFCGIGDEITRDTAICATNNAVTSNNIYDCTTGTLTCDNSANFCHSTEALRDSCNPRTHNCGLNNQGSGSARRPLDPATPGDDDATVIYVTAPDSSPAAITPVDVSRAAYTPLSTEPIPTGFTTWEGDDDAIDTDGAAGAHRDAEYKAGGGADQIYAAYAYARGYTGDGIVVSSMDSAIASYHLDLADRVLDRGTSTAFLGYDADNKLEGDNEGTCGAFDFTTACTDADNHGTHLVGIIAGAQGNGGIRGIAYGARIKPIDIVAGNVFKADTADRREKLNLAIAQASGMTRDGAGMKQITVMNNGWDVSGVGTITQMLGSVTPTAYTEYYKTANRVSTITDAEIDAWIEAVKTTVVVFGAGDYGHNRENGKVQLYKDKALTIKAKEIGDDGAEEPDDREKLAWKDIDSENRNIASSHARLPLEIIELQGKWLTVIALDSDNRIADFSNGCGDAQNFCLGAPGVGITSITPTSLGVSDEGTAQAAAHVSGAVAVLKGAFPNLTPAQLVSVILNSADRLGEGKTFGTDNIYGHGALNLAKATAPLGDLSMSSFGNQRLADARIDNSGITLPTSFGSSLTGFTAGFTDDYNRAFVGSPARISRTNAAFTLADTIATWQSPELQSIALDSNSKMQFTNYDEDANAKDTLIFTHNLPNHTIGFLYNEESKNPDLMLAGKTDDLHFQKIRPIATDLMQVNSTHKLGKAWNVKNAITSGEFDTGNRFNEAMANLNYTGENRNLTIGAGTLKEYGQFLGASGTGAYQLSDATSSQVTHLAVTQNLPRNSAIKLKYTNFKTEVDMRYNNFANINDLTANEYQLGFAKQQILGKSDSLNIELIQPFAVTDGTLQQNTVLGYNAQGDYNNVTQNYSLKPTNRRQQLRMTWQNQLNRKNETKLFISMQYENHAGNLRDNEESSILGGISTRF